MLGAWPWCADGWCRSPQRAPTDSSTSWPRGASMRIPTRLGPRGGTRDAKDLAREDQRGWAGGGVGLRAYAPEPFLTLFTNDVENTNSRKFAIASFGGEPPPFRSKWGEGSFPRR